MPAAPGIPLDADQLVESLPDIVWVNLPDGRTVFVNQAGMDLIGLRQDPGGALAPWFDSVHPDDLDSSFGVWQRATSTGDGFAHELRLRDAQGGYRWVVVRGEPVRGDAGEIICWAGTCTDIEAIKQTELALAEAERARAEFLALLDAVQRAAPIGFAFVDRGFRFVRVNETLAAIDGLPVEDHLGREVREVVPDLWPQLEPIYRRVADGEAIHDIEIHGVTPGTMGAARTWMVSYYPVALKGEVLGIGVIARDVTAEKQIEADSARAAEQRRALLAEVFRAQDAERRRITGELHDECVPRVAATRMELEAIRRALSDPLHATTVGRLDESLQWMQRRLRDLIFELRPPALDRGLEAALAEHLSQVGVAAQAATHFKYSLDREPPLDTTELVFRIAREALANAQRHARAATITLEVGSTDDGVGVVVTDDGIGFDPAAPRRPGHIGLDLMRERAELGGGTLRIESEPGAGTRIELWMPRDGHVSATRSGLAA